MFRSLTRVVVAVTIGVGSGAACANRHHTASPNPGAASDGNIRAQQADVVVTDPAAQSSVSLKVGQTLGIVTPSGGTLYQVDYAASQLRLLTPRKPTDQPGDRGWVWRAIATGDLDIQITGRAPCPSPPCAENPVRYTITVTVAPSSAPVSLPATRRMAPRDRDARDPDEPDEALRWRQIFERDEFGRIAPDGLMNAHRQWLAMRGRQSVTAQMTGEPAAGAGITSGAWSWIGPGNIGGRTRAIAIHPTTTSTMFAGSVGGGIWKTTNSGATWNPVDDFMANLAVTSIVYLPTNPSIMFAGTGEGFFNVDAIRGAGVFRSTDGGGAWAQLPATAPTVVFQDFNFVNELAISLNGSTILAATGTGVWRSLDNGNSWSQRLAVSSMQDVKFIPGSSTLAVAGGRIKNAYYSTDGGLTWTPSTGMTTGGSGKRVELGVSVSSPAVVYASVAEGGSASTPPAEVWKSTDGGISYTRVNNQATSLLGAQGWYDNTIWVDPTNVNHVLVGGVSVFRSTDGGATFGAAFSGGHADQHAFVSDPGFNGTTNRRVYVANDGGVYKWEDVTVATTTRLNNNFGVTQYYGADGLTSTGKIFGGTQDNGTLLYVPASGPQAWVAIAGGDGGYATADRVNDYMYGEFQWLQVHRSVNGGTSSLINGCSKPAPYRLDDGCTSKSTTTNFIAPILLDPNSPDRLYAGGYQLWRSNDPRTANTATTGPSWASVKPTVSSAISAIAIGKSNSSRVWVGHNNGDVYSTDDALSATPTWFRRDLNAPGLPNRAVTSITVDPQNADVVYVAFGGFNAGNLWMTANNGASWTGVTGVAGSQLPAVPVRSVVRHPTAAGWLYVGTDVGIFASQNGGTNWSLPQDGPANVAVFQVFFMGTTLVAVTHGRGLFTVDVSDPLSPPSITVQPQSYQAIASGATANLSVTAVGSQTITYQWYLGASGNTATPVVGATLSTFTTPALNATTSYWVRVSNGSGSVDSATAVIAVTPAPVPATASPDFTGDGKSDILWRHVTRGEVWLWPMNGAAKTAEDFVRTVPDTNWEIRGQGDQTGDGKADLLWRNKTTGAIFLWPMNGSTPLSETYIATVDPAYDIVGTGDYNSDRKSDILWRHGTNGQVWIWLMDGASVQSSVHVDTVDPMYAIVGSGDLDGDQKADIVWRHTTTGDVWVWLMDGTTRLSQTLVGTVPDLGYQVMGVADYTGDRKADILWRHTTAGHVWIWPMDGATLVTQSYVGTVDPIYKIVGTGDYDGDLKADILWHHATTGDVWVWLMNGATIVSQTLVGKVPDIGYLIVKWK